MKDFLFLLLAWLLTLPVLIGSITFAVYNGQDVTLITNPFKDSSTVPLYMPVLSAVAIGFLFGTLMTWAAMGRLRAKARAQAKQIKALEKKIEDEKSPSPQPHNYASIPLKLLGRR